MSQKYTGELERRREASDPLVTDWNTQGGGSGTLRAPCCLLLDK